MTPAPLFYDRRAAGEQLAKAIAAQISQLDPAEVEKPPIVYGLPRGGLPVAEPVARRLGCPLDIMVAKKITRPDNPELAIGAVTADGEVLWVKQRSRRFRFRRLAQAEATAKAQAQEALFASRRPQVQPAGAIAQGPFFACTPDRWRQCRRDFRLDERDGRKILVSVS